MYCLCTKNSERCGAVERYLECYMETDYRRCFVDKSSFPRSRARSFFQTNSEGRYHPPSPTAGIHLSAASDGTNGHNIHIICTIFAAFELVGSRAGTRRQHQMSQGRSLAREPGRCLVQPTNPLQKHATPTPSKPALFPSVASGHVVVKNCRANVLWFRVLFYLSHYVPWVFTYFFARKGKKPGLVIWDCSVFFFFNVNPNLLLSYIIAV